MPRTRSGFSLVELVVVVAIVALLAGVVTPRLSQRMAASRDTRRLQDIQRVRDAIEQYHLEHGAYPAANSSATYGGWDVSHDGNFISVLTQEGFLESPPMDPLNDATFHYRYYVYASGSYGCGGSSSFYVLGVRRFETTDFAARNTGYFKCSGRDWGSEFAFVTGGGASYQ